MTAIPLFCDSQKEWFLVEMQGTLHPRSHSSSSGGSGSSNNAGHPSIDGLPVGPVSFGKDPEGKSVVLSIGPNHLDGSMVSLSKPVAIFRKVHSVSTESPHLAKYIAPVGYTCVGVARKKFIFKSRPRPEIGAP